MLSLLKVLTHSLTHSLIHSHSLTHSLTHLFTHTHSLTHSGTIAQVNDALRYVYYFAPNDTNGNVTLEVTATDHPLPCTMSPAMLPIKTLAYAPYALPAYPVTPQSNDTVVDSKLCDDQQIQVLTHSPNHLLTHSPNHLLTHSQLPRTSPCMSPLLTKHRLLR